MASYFLNISPKVANSTTFSELFKNKSINRKLIERKKELCILQKALDSNEPEMVALIGRRRVGKTFLVRTAYKNQLVFEVTGLQNATKVEQLQNFALRLNNYAKYIVN